MPSPAVVVMAQTIVEFPQEAAAYVSSGAMPRINVGLEMRLVMADRTTRDDNRKITGRLRLSSCLEQAPRRRRETPAVAKTGLADLHAAEGLDVTYVAPFGTVADWTS